MRQAGGQTQAEQGVPMRPLRFQDRADAGRQLAGALARFRGRRPLVLAIPRGGVPLGREIADALDGELDVVLVHKLGAPDNPEYAIGAVDEAGGVELSPVAARVPQEYLAAEVAHQRAALVARRHRYGGALSDPGGRIVIVVDDGIATGATLKAALRLLRQRKPAELVAAIPVAPPESLLTLQELADKVACLATPEDFMAVGQYYADFGQVEDEQVEALVHPAAGRPG